MIVTSVTSELRCFRMKLNSVSQLCKNWDVSSSFFIINFFLKQLAWSSVRCSWNCKIFVFPNIDMEIIYLQMRTCHNSLSVPPFPLFAWSKLSSQWESTNRINHLRATRSTRNAFPIRQHLSGPSPFYETPSVLSWTHPALSFPPSLPEASFFFRAKDLCT